MLANDGILTLLELTNASRDVCIIYMLPVRVLEQKHCVRRRLTLKKNKYSKAPPEEMALIQALIQNSICGSMFSKKVEQSTKESEEVSVTSVYQFCMLCCPCTHTYYNTFVMAFLAVRETDL